MRENNGFFGDGGLDSDEEGGCCIADFDFDDVSLLGDRETGEDCDLLGDGGTPGLWVGGYT